MIVAPPVARLTRGVLPLSALAIGSLTPDVEYFLQLRPWSTWGHTPLGLLVWDLPVGLLLLLLLHGLVRGPVLLLLPDLQRRRLLGLPAWRWGPPARFARICAAVLLGAASHVALDAATHEHGALVERVAVLRADVAGLPVYKALQLGLGALFSAMLVGLYVRWLRRAPEVEAGPGWSATRRRVVWAVLAVGGLALGLVTGLRVAGGVPRTPAQRAPFVVGAAIGAHSAVAVLLVLFSIGVRLRRSDDDDLALRW